MSDLTYVRALRPNVTKLASKLAPALALLGATFVSSCSDESGGGGGSVARNPDGGTPVLGGSSKLDAEDYCTRLCKVADDCDEDFDKQTCQNRCENQSSAIVKLNPKAEAAIYECFDDSSCKEINSSEFVADCLRDAAAAQTPSKDGKTFCKKLEEAADECDFDDYEESRCLDVTTAFADPVLKGGAICAGKKCELIVDCLQATFTLPGELDGASIGLNDDGKIAGGSDALPAVVALLPKTADDVSGSPVNPSVSPQGDADASTESVDPDLSDDEETTDDPRSDDTSNDEPIDTTTEPAPTDSSEPAPTTGDSSDPNATDSSDLTDPTDTTDSDTTDTDTTDTTDADTTGVIDPEACDNCRYEFCSAEEFACVNDPEGENLAWYTCLEFDSAVVECDELYSEPEQENQWYACYDAALANTSDQSLQLHDTVLACLFYDAVVECAQLCE